jgi:hypothetical protein
MPYPNRSIAFFCIPFVLTFCLLSLGSAQESLIELQYKNQALSADLKEAPLKAVVEKIKEWGIWVKGEEHLVNRQVSTQFKNLSVRDGMKRIFSGISYCLIFGRKSRLDGLIIIGRARPRAHPTLKPKKTPKLIRPKKTPKK